MLLIDSVSLIFLICFVIYEDIQEDWAALSEDARCVAKRQLCKSVFNTFFKAWPVTFLGLVWWAYRSLR